jgi:8-oxo-dGTP pyrophosphatase MutT (NUDIX family)
MQSAEQLSLPNFSVPEAGPVAVVMLLKDTDTPDPKVLMSERPDGTWMYTGGKLRANERRRPRRGGKRETKEETGIDIYDDECLIEHHLSPIRVATHGVERDLHVMYSFAEECADTDTPELREPDKNGPWRYVPLRELPAMIAAGKTHPFTSRVDLSAIAEEAREAVAEDVTEEFAAMGRRRESHPIDPREPGFLVYIHERDAVRQQA